jgi:hypothetical protein
MTRPKPAATDGTSKRTFTVLVGCDWGTGYQAPGTVTTDVPADVAATWIDEGVIAEGTHPAPEPDHTGCLTAYPTALPVDEQEG